MNFIPISWEQLEKDTIVLARKIQDEKIDEIISISRGGMVVARLLSDLLNLPISHIAIESYAGLQAEKEPVVTQSSPRVFQGETVLLVDELSDSGKTFLQGLSYLQTLPIKRVITTAPYIKPHTSYKPDFWLKELDGWIIFPYEIRETKTAFEKEFGQEEALKKLHELGVLDWEK